MKYFEVNALVLEVIKVALLKVYFQFRRSILQFKRLISLGVLVLVALKVNIYVILIIRPKES